MWNDITGTFTQACGTAGTVTLPKNAIVTRIYAHASAASATVSVPAFMAVALPIPATSTLPAYVDLQYNHTMLRANLNGYTIVFAGTDAFLVEYYTQP